MPQVISSAQLQVHLAQQALAPVYALIGEEDLIRDQALASLKLAVLGEEGNEFNCDLFYGDEAEGTEIVACASEVAVFSSRRLVIVKAADKLPAREGEILLSYFEEPNGSSTLVFVAPKLDGRLKFTQALTKTAVTVDCSPLKESQCVVWLRQEADRVGLRLNEDALLLLRELCGESLYSVRRELEKLASYLPADRSVTAADVEIMRGARPGESVFDLAAAVGAGNRGRALTIVGRNIEAGEAPLKILGSLAWQYRRLWKVKELVRQGGREGEAARTLRMDQTRVRAFLNQFSEAHLRRAIRELMQTDAQLKGGSGGRPSMILDRLVFRLCEKRSENLQPVATRPTTTSASTARMRQVPNVRTITRGPRPTS